MLSVLPQLLFILALLVFLGEPLRATVLKQVNMFSDLDFLQIYILDVFIGGFLLFALAVLPIGLFSLPVTIGLTVFCIIASFVIHRTSLIGWFKSSKKDFFTKNRQSILIYLLVFLMMIIFISINLNALSGFVYGSVRDESIHSLYVQVISENHFIPFTLQPYMSEAIVYPQASHVIFTYAYYMTNMDIPQIILYVSVLFKGLAVLAAYFLGKKLGKSKLYGLGLSFVIAFISSWPLNVTWGANPFIMGFPLFLICLGLLYSVYRNFSYIELALLGLLVGYNGALVLTYFETFTLAALMVFASLLLIKSNGGLRRALAGFGTVFLASLIPLSFFMYRFIAVYSYPNHNIGLPSDIILTSNNNEAFLNQTLQWAFDNLSPYLMLKLLTIFIIAAFAILLLLTGQYKNNDDNILRGNRFAIAIFASALVLSIIALFLTPGIDVISTGHQGILLSIPLSILTLNFFVKLTEALRKSKLDGLTRRLSFSSLEKGTTVSVLAAIIIISALAAPFVYYRATADSENLTGLYNVYAVTTQGDYELMHWMKENLTSSAVILVHPFEAGLFIPSVSNHKIVYPYTASYLSASYQRLVHLLENSTLNATTYQLLSDLNITHIYVGSNVAYSNNEFGLWNPDLFIGNPNFKLVKNSGGSYLFEVSITNPSVLLYNDFENTNLTQSFWASNQAGYGVGNATITGAVGSKALTLAAKAEPTAYDWSPRFAYFTEKKLYNGNASDVTLSFNYDLINGFSGNDTFAVTVSNPEKAEAIVFSTQNGVFQNYTGVNLISGSRGEFSYNLSELWQQKYDSPLPDAIIIRLITYDFDGNQNIVLIDNVTVAAASAR